ncbi:MAG: RNA methyltransferase [Treponema sp.]|nr:RNA methyltransferase [Treponema sp.]
MNLKNIVIVLDHPDESRNIGAACRAMANNDVSTLRIVGKIEDYDVEHIHVLAIHAGAIFDKAEFFDSITDATKDCTICAGTTRRRGKKRGKLLLPEEFAVEASKITSMVGGSDNRLVGGCDESLENEASVGVKNERLVGGKVAVVFGNERTGLTDEQLDQCTMGVTIPSSDNFGSLNLSHAVQILCYHLFRENLKEENKIVAGYKPLDLERLDKTVSIVTDNMQKIGFFKMPGREDMEYFWRSILSRAALSEGEAQYLEKTFGKIAGLKLASAKESPEK